MMHACIRAKYRDLSTFLPNYNKREINHSYRDINQNIHIRNLKKHIYRYSDFYCLLKTMKQWNKSIQQEHIFSKTCVQTSLSTAPHGNLFLTESCPIENWCKFCQQNARHCCQSETLLLNCMKKSLRCFVHRKPFHLSMCVV